MKNLLLSLSTLFLLNISHASSLQGESSFWQCASFDREGKQWIAKSSFQRIALNKAFDLCKKGSPEPASCEVASQFCEATIKGYQAPKWQCSAFDKMAHVFASDYYRNRDDAAVGAKQYCQHQSAFPDSCYIRLMTCRSNNNY